MFNPLRWVLNAFKPTQTRRRRINRSGCSLVENLESRQLLTTIFSEGFEGIFPADNAWVTNTSQGRTWDDNNTIAHSGTWSGFGSELNNNGVENPLTYVNGMDTTMSKTVDLTNYHNTTLSWYQWLNTESTHDTLTVSVSANGKSVILAPFSGNIQSWTQKTLQLDSSFDGAASVTITFKFHSDGSVIGAAAGNKGVWVDDILLDGRLDEGFPLNTIDVNHSNTRVYLNQFGDATVASQSIGSATDQQYYRFGADIDGNYTITTTPNGNLDPEFRLYDENGASITPGLIDTGNAGVTETHTFSLKTGHFYTLVVGGYNTSTGTFGVSINGPTTSSTTVATPAPVFTGSVNAAMNTLGDVDFYKITAPANSTTVTLDLTTDPSIDGVMNIYDTNGTLLFKVDLGSQGASETKTMNVTPGVTYVVGITDYGFDETGTYSLKANFDPDEPPQVAAVKLHKGNNKKVDKLYVVFDQTVDQTTVEQIAANYVLVGPNGPLQPGFTSAQWNPNSKTCVLTLNTPIATSKLKNYKLQVLGTGTIHNLQNSFLDGNGDGVAGGDYQIQLNQASYA